MCPVAPERERGKNVFHCLIDLLVQGKAGFREPRPPFAHFQQGLKYKSNTQGYHLKLTSQEELIAMIK